jgi:DNA/RNA-binding domain of Phe-tRNA-synthetase-like protein
MLEVRIEESIFQDYPDFRRGLVFAAGLDNHGPSLELESMLNEAVINAARQPIDVKTDARVTVWNDAHRRFGSNPNKFPPAHAALLKRLQKGGIQLPFINKAVAIMNYHSITEGMPVGGDDVERAGSRLVLKRAEGSEVFVPLGSPETKEHPAPGEVIYVAADSAEIMCRRWNWRNGHGTRLTEDTRTMVMNIDGLGEGSEARAVATRDRVARMLERFCGAETEVALLSPSKPVWELDA